MRPSTLVRAVGGEGLGAIADLDLVGHVARRRGGDLGEVVDEGAIEPGGPELDGDAEPVVVAAVLGDEGVVGVVEMEVTGELVERGLAGEAPVTKRP